MSIMAEIVELRRSRVRAEGHALGAAVAAERTAPLVPFGRSPFVICEIKRSSPSKGEISAALDAPAQAAIYARQGARSVSVLTEEDHFRGSLADLMAVKRTNPDLAVLRKDFLLSIEDIDISYRAGADAVLLIAGVLERDELERMYRRATELGLECLVEVHTIEEIAKVRELAPRFTGINARDLRTFAVDLALPITLRASIDWETRVVFESGMRSREHAAFASGAGFEGILVGEAVVRRPELVGELIAGLADGANRHGAASAGEPGDGPGPGRRDFWRRLYAARSPRRSGWIATISGARPPSALMSASLPYVRMYVPLSRSGAIARGRRRSPPPAPAPASGGSKAASSRPPLQRETNWNRSALMTPWRHSTRRSPARARRSMAYAGDPGPKPSRTRWVGEGMTGVTRSHPASGRTPQRSSSSR